MGSKEEELIRRAKSLKVRAAEVPLGPLQDLVEDASKQLSPSHHITIEALDTVAQLGASKAVSQEMTQQFMAMMGGPRTNPYGMPTTTFRKIAAVAGLEAVVASECVAAGCHGCCSGKLFTGKDFQLPHDPVYEVAVKVFHACTDLMAIPESSRPTYASPIVERYLPSMRGHFGDDDEDVPSYSRKAYQYNAASEFLFCTRNEEAKVSAFDKEKWKERTTIKTPLCGFHGY
jgi:hypothetical protein